jgi:hypothetical protein
MIANEVQYLAAKGHLERFDRAAANLEAQLARNGPPKLLQMELDAVRSQADDLRAEIVEYERVHSI